MKARNGRNHSNNVVASNTPTRPLLPIVREALTPEERSLLAAYTSAFVQEHGAGPALRDELLARWRIVNGYEDLVWLDPNGRRQKDPMTRLIKQARAWQKEVVVAR